MYNNILKISIICVFTLHVLMYIIFLYLNHTYYVK